jgi:5-(carboxyamino)imidazole ribonucleotide synthase
MMNFIGDLPDVARVLRVPGAHLHLYGKEPRAGRKVGHVTLCAKDRDSLAERLAMLEMP